MRPMMHGPWMRAGRDEDFKNAKVDRTLARRVWGYGRPYKSKLAMFLGAVVLGSLVALVPPLVFRQIVDHAIPDQDRGQAITLAVLAIFVAVVSTGLGVVERWFSARIGEGVIFDLRTSLYDHVHRMPIAFFTRTQTGALVSRMNNDVIGAQRALTGTLGSVVGNLLTLGTTLTAMFVLEWRLTLLTLLIAPLLLVPAERVGRKMQDIAREGMEVNASMNATMNERFNVSGAMLVKLFGRHDAEVASFARKAARVRDIGVRSSLFSQTFFAAMGLVGALGLAVVYLVGSLQVISGAITLGTMVALAAYVTRIYQPLTSLSSARIDILLAFVSFERVFELLDTPRLIDDKPDAIELTSPKGRVELDDVWFRYPAANEVSIPSLEGDGDSSLALDDRPGAFVLQGITATIEPGQLVALVGPSGGGKTTLSSLVPRLYDVTSGAVRIDGHDVRDLTQESLRAAMGVVSQDPHLFHDSIRNNLRYAKRDATDDELVAACRAAQIHDMIASLPDGYDTLVGERGYRLSGGEKQRLAIARMLLKDPAIVILDEATSHLDAENEALIQDALAVGLDGRTSIVIAHRLSTVRSADVILVLDEGRIVERGTHDELRAAGGLYAELYTTLVRGDLTAT
ncbi:MAG TPA: ABC transporter ATP-binding protein [Acidimicrobiales bacterium]|nr:ABC transporter ATP-binding protein [Acidimicrobiales bacterium]